MSDNVFGERFLGRDKPAWHNLGKVFSGKMGAREAIIEAGCDFEIVKVPLVGALETPDGIVALDAKGAGLFREPTADDPKHLHLGNVSKDFEVIQNLEMADMLEPFTEEWPVETVAALKDGAVVFITLNMGKYMVCGETTDQYLALTNYHNGGGSFDITWTDVRRVCWNTVKAGDAVASLHIKLRHTPGVKENAQWYAEQLVAIRAMVKRKQEIFEQLGETKVSDGQVYKYIDQVFPMPKQTQKSRFMEAAAEVAPEAAAQLEKASEDRRLETAREWAGALRDKSWERYGVIADQFPAIHGTAYGAYHAVNEVINWREGANADESIVNPQGARSRELARAFDKALELVPVLR